MSQVITLCCRGHLEASIESLARVRTAGDLTGPMLWAPVASASRLGRRLPTAETSSQYE